MLTFRQRVLLLAAGVFSTFPAEIAAQTPVLTWHNDAARTGQNLLETILTPANVHSTTFGKLFQLSVDGKVDAEPLYVPAVNISGQGPHNVLYVVTEHDSLYAFDADTGTQLWQVSFLINESPSDARGCGQVSPEIGITSTPAIDLTVGPHGTMYLVTMTKDASNNYHQRLHAVDITTGGEQFGGPVLVQATFPNNTGTTTFDPKQYKDRAALLVQNGVVYTSWASHCDINPYGGWVIAYNKTTLARTSVINLTPNGNRGSIWQAGAGPAADPGGNLFFLLANGTFDTTLNGSNFPNKGDFGNAFMNLSTASGLSVADYFTMDNTTNESNADVDLGSGGAMVLPTLNDALGHARVLAVGAGKDHSGYVVDRNNMGKFHSMNNAVYQILDLGGPVFSSPAWFNGTLYYGPVNQHLQAFTYSAGAFSTSPTSQSPTTFQAPGTTPSISANGTSNGIVWAAENGSTAVLHAYDASNLGNELYNSNQAASNRDHFGTGNKFITPMVANGKVYVGTTNGVGVFGLIGCTYSLSASSQHFTSSAGGGSVDVTAPNGCSWIVSNTSTFITLTGTTSGNGNGTVSFTITADPGVSRGGILVIAGHSFTVTQDGDTMTSGLAYYPVPPCRIADTRANSGFSGFFGAPSLTGGTARSFPVPQSACNIPSNAGAYSLNITVVPPGPLQSLTAWPTGASTPSTITLSSPSGHIVGNATIVEAGTNGGFNLLASNNSDVVIDINGYFAPPAVNGLVFYPMTPCRIADTRSGAAGSGLSGAFGPPTLTGKSTRKFPIPSSACNVPPTAQAYSFRMTVVPPGNLQFLTAYPAGETLPLVATLNAPNGGVVGNAAIVPAGTNGAISVFVTNRTDLVIDINGYFAPPGGANPLFFFPVAECRVADTRANSGFADPFGPPSLLGNSTREFPIQMSSCNIPAEAQAYSMNMTVVTSGLGFLTAYPSGQSLPLAATLNALGGGTVGAGTIVPAGGDGGINVFASNPTDLMIDIGGYFAP